MRVVQTRMLLLVGAIVLLGLGGALLSTIARSPQTPDRTATASPSAADGRASFVFSMLDKPRVLPDVRFVEADGTSKSLADYRGRAILLNIWATWCVPCRAEMASLDRLQRKLGSGTLLVMPLSIDRQGAAVVKKFYGELGLQALGIYVDQSGKAARDLDALGVPTTLLIDRQGHEIGRKIGAAEWDGDELAGLIARQIGASAVSQDEARQ